MARTINLLYAIFLVSYFYEAHSLETNAVVQVEQGELLGKLMNSESGGSYYSFSGVPFARPPIGHLRFKDAQPPENWVGVRNATEEGEVCSQFSFELNAYTGSEDCLHLNVYTPELPEEGKQLRPVLVWFFGGGFVFGSTQTFRYGPDYIVSENVVLVSVSSRLGPLGFMYMNEEAPGNAGLKDQVLALRWLKKNIAAFGGDPNNVTLFGISSGSAAITYHLLSPMSQGLFHKAIPQSGSVINKWAIDRTPLQRSRSVAEAVGCSVGNDSVTIECLRGIDHFALIEAAKALFPIPKERCRVIPYTFPPTIDFEAPGVERFLEEEPQQLLEQGRINSVPLMIGLTSQECVMLVRPNNLNVSNAEEINQLEDDWKEAILDKLRFPGETPEELAYQKNALRNFYLQGQPITNSTLNGYINMLSDVTYGEGVMFTYTTIVKNYSSPIYLYNFNIDDALNFQKVRFNITWPGVAHADEITYLFLSEIYPNVSETSSAGVGRRRMVRLWANFAKTGNPTPEDDPVLGVKWIPYTQEDQKYLDIGSSLEVGTDKFADRIAFWQSLYSNRTR